MQKFLKSKRPVTTIRPSPKILYNQNIPQPQV